MAQAETMRGKGLHLAAVFHRARQAVEEFVTGAERQRQEIADIERVLRGGEITPNDREKYIAEQYNRCFTPAPATSGFDLGGSFLQLSSARVAQEMKRLGELATEELDKEIIANVRTRAEDLGLLKESNPAH